MLLRKIARRIKDFIKQRVNSIINKVIRKKRISIISNNCGAAYLYKNFNCKYLSPTINLQMSPSDFVRFCSNLKFYLSLEIVQVKNPDCEGFRKLGGSTIDFPVGKLGDIILYFQHYKNFDIAVKKWNERKERINFDNMYFILIDTYCDKALVKDFLSLPYKNKLFLTEREDLLFNTNCLHLQLNGKVWYASNWIRQCNFIKRFIFMN